MQSTFVNQLVSQTIGDYFIEQLLGQGELGAAYKAQQQTQKRTVMIMVFLVPEEFSPQVRERILARFMQESERLAKLHHPNLVPLYDFGEYTGYPYLVLPFVKNRSLASMLKEQVHFTPKKTLNILTQVAAGLDYAHSNGIVHGSLSPTTILLDEQYRAQVAELGFVRMLEMSGIESSYPYAHRFSIAGTFLGTSAYVAPEWVETQSMDARTDIYALGVIIFELLSEKQSLNTTGPLIKAPPHIPSQGPLLSTAHPTMQAYLEPVLRQALERNPELRFQSAGEMARAFEKALEVMQQVRQASPMTTPATLQSSTKLQSAVESRRRVVAMIAAGSVITAGVFGITALNLSHPVQSEVQAAPATDQVHSSTSSAPEQTTTPYKSHHSNHGKQTHPSKSKPIATSTPGSAPHPVSQPIPTSPPFTPAPTPHPPTGTTIGSTAHPINTASNFINPADGNLSTLIHLPDGGFVAYEKACTHQSAIVRYHPVIHKLVCPKHHAVFDPANGGSVVQGPAPRALPSVTIVVNADGTITTG